MAKSISPKMYSKLSLLNMNVVGDFANVLEEVYRDGRLVKEMTFEQIRANARA